jgi:hypothetical protein
MTDIPAATARANVLAKAIIDGLLSEATPADTGDEISAAVATIVVHVFVHGTSRTATRGEIMSAFDHWMRCIRAEIIHRMDIGG